MQTDQRKGWVVTLALFIVCGSVARNVWTVVGLLVSRSPLRTVIRNVFERAADLETATPIIAAEIANAMLDCEFI